MRYLLKGSTLVLALAALVSLGACTHDDPTGAIQGGEVAVLSVSPSGGATNVDPSSAVTVEFDHPMVEGMEAYCRLHEGGLEGTEVPGQWEWSENHQRLTFSPDEPFQRAHEYTLHLGGGMQDEHGHHLNFEQYGYEMGGHWVDGHMLGGDMMGGSGHMGGGWLSQNGMYGMAFPFTVAP